MNGFSAKCFFNPLEALAAAAEQAPHLLISDVVMPQLSGVDLAVQTRLLCPNCTILLFSGQAATADLMQQARDQGYEFPVLTKPVHPNDLLRRIRSQGEAWNGTSKVPALVE